MVEGPGQHIHEGIHMKDHLAMEEITSEMVDDTLKVHQEDTTVTTQGDTRGLTPRMEPPLQIIEEDTTTTEVEGDRITQAPLGNMGDTKKMTGDGLSILERLLAHMVDVSRKNEDHITLAMPVRTMFDMKTPRDALRRTIQGRHQRHMTGATIVDMIENMIAAWRWRLEVGGCHPCHQLHHGHLRVAFLANMVLE